MVPLFIRFMPMVTVFIKFMAMATVFIRFKNRYNIADISSLGAAKSRCGTEKRLVIENFEIHEKFQFFMQSSCRCELSAHFYPISYEVHRIRAFEYNLKKM